MTNESREAGGTNTENPGKGNIIPENKGAIAFALLLMLLGSGAYFASGAGTGSAMAKSGSSPLFDAIRFKVAFGPDGVMHLFANTKNNALAGLATTAGNPIPEENSIVIGNSQAARVKDGGRFMKQGDPISGYFGIDTSLEGVLAKQGNAIDELYFLSSRQFEKVDGEKDRVFARVSPQGIPKLF